MFKWIATERWLKRAAQMEDEGGFTGVAGKGPYLSQGPAETPAEPDASGYKVPYTTILAINPHTNADRLELATVYGFQVVIGKGNFKVGDKVIYIPIDSILSPQLEAILFPPTAKIKLNKSRVRQIKIRGLASQGMLVSPDEVRPIVNPDYFKDEQDVRAFLGVNKYEPPVKTVSLGPNAGKKGRKKLANPHFHQYNGLGNIKWFPNMFKDGDEVVIQEKIHGSNCRAGLLPYNPNTIFKKLMKWLGFSPAHEFCYGSNRVDISSAGGTYKGWYGEDHYGAVLKKADAANKLKPNETVFGELCGPGIQKGYSYGLKEHEFAIFDVKILNADGTQSWLTPDEVEAFAKERGFTMVPVLYKGPFNKEMAYHLTKGGSEFGDKSEKVREGIVIKAAKEYTIAGNKQALKYISEEYLADETNTDEH